MARGVVAIGDFAQAGQFEDVNARRQPVPADIIRANCQEHRRPGFERGERGGDGKVPARVAKTQPVVRIKQKAHTSR